MAYHLILKQTVLCFLLGLSVLASHAKEAPAQVILQDDIPQENYLIELSPGESRWVTEEEKWALKRDGTTFMDITAGSPGTSQGGVLQQKSVVRYPQNLSYPGPLQDMLKSLNQSSMYQNLEMFTSFKTRYYKSAEGVKSATWLLEQVNSTIVEAGAHLFGATVEQFKHPWGQHSVIARLPGRRNDTIVIGAHQDSINLFLPSFLPAPGADDDGSGTVTILEALRVFLSSDAILHGNLTNTVEFHWYSAEEGGLLGSQAIFKSYEDSHRPVKAMLQQDMTGYTKDTLASGKPESVGIITDYVDAGLTEFLKKIVTAYCDIPYVETKCGYACSDHASASKAGYPSAFVIESEFKYSDKRIHTTQDTIDRLNFDHMLQHARLTLATAYELGVTEFSD